VATAWTWVAVATGRKKGEGDRDRRRAAVSAYNNVDNISGHWKYSNIEGIYDCGAVLM
jgi:hypothetical protein